MFSIWHKKKKTTAHNILTYYITLPKGRGSYCFWYGYCWGWCQPHTFLSALYLVNEWLNSYQIFMDIWLGYNKELIRFGDIDLTVKVTAVEKLKIHCVGTCVFSENTVTSFLIFPIKLDMAFPENCLLRRQFVWKVKSYSMEKISFVICWIYLRVCY